MRSGTGLVQEISLSTSCSFPYGSGLGTSVPDIASDDTKEGGGIGVRLFCALLYLRIYPKISSLGACPALVPVLKICALFILKYLIIHFPLTALQSSFCHVRAC